MRHLLRWVLVRRRVFVIAALVVFRSIGLRFGFCVTMSPGWTFEIWWPGTELNRRPLGYECNLTRNFSELRGQG